jgi:hypothetical protein
MEDFIATFDQIFDDANISLMVWSYYINGDDIRFNCTYYNEWIFRVTIYGSVLFETYDSDLIGVACSYGGISSKFILLITDTKLIIYDMLLKALVVIFGRSIQYSKVELTNKHLIVVSREELLIFNFLRSRLIKTLDVVGGIAKIRAVSSILYFSTNLEPSVCRIYDLSVLQ